MVNEKNLEIIGGLTNGSDCPSDCRFQRPVGPGRMCVSRPVEYAMNQSHHIAHRLGPMSCRAAEFGPQTAWMLLHLFENPINALGK